MAHHPMTETSDTTFDARRYWEERLRAHPDITGVGYLGRSPRFVELQYRARAEQLDRALQHFGLTDLSRRAVLDVGSGTGIWLDYWSKRGAAQVVGLDFAQPSVDALRKQFPKLSIVQADLSVSPLPLPQGSRFDIITACDVLLHIVTPDGFQRAIANLAEHCAPGGWLITFDPVLRENGYVPQRSYAVHNKVRTLREYREVLEGQGFVIEAVRPVTVLLNTPLEASSRLAYLALLANWKATGYWGRSRLLSRVLTPPIMGADRLACRFNGGSIAPGSKIILARKQG